MYLIESYNIYNFKDIEKKYIFKFPEFLRYNDF